MNTPQIRLHDQNNNKQIHAPVSRVQTKSAHNYCVHNLSTETLSAAIPINVPLKRFQLPYQLMYNEIVQHTIAFSYWYRQYTSEKAHINRHSTTIKSFWGYI